MKKLNILVFPCGSEIGLEIHRSLKYSVHVELFGANSIDDHGRFVYENYIGNLPFIDSENIIGELNTIIERKKIDAIYPSMDRVIWKLKMHETDLNCKVISSEFTTTDICLSKSKTYSLLRGKARIPEVYTNMDNIEKYPVFLKPDTGYGSRNVYTAKNPHDLKGFLSKIESEKYIVCEYLPGKEYTVDCFTDRKGKLLFFGGRQRARISNGISVNTFSVSDDIFSAIAYSINTNLKLRGAWFFQVKEDLNGKLVIMEIAARLGGSSSLHRNLGINFALLSVFDAFDINVEMLRNNYTIELDRALDNRYKINYRYQTVYVDFDDCLIIDSKVNTQLASFLYDCLNNDKRLVLMTKHADNINLSLKKYRLTDVFDEIIHINHNDSKANHINDLESIFIDDSFSERKEVKLKHNIPVFSNDMIESLI